MRLFRKQPGPWEPQERFNGLTETDFNTLARYNGERAHGIMHTPEWQEKMAALQARFDATEHERLHFLHHHAARITSSSHGAGDHTRLWTRA